MNSSRTLVIQDRVFSADSLRRLAQVFAQQFEQARALGNHATASYAVTFSDASSLRSDSPDILDNEILNGPSRPYAVTFSFTDFEDDKSLSLSIAHGDRIYGNHIDLESGDDAWVKATYLTLKEIIDSIPPQESWFKRHPTIMLHSIALGIGTLFMLVVTLGFDVFFALGPEPPISPLPEDSPWRAFILHFLPVFYVIGWLWRWFIGLIWAHEVRSWLFRLWPNIELDVGPEHLKTEKRQRARLATVAALVVLPIILNVTYDIIRYAF